MKHHGIRLIALYAHAIAPRFKKTRDILPGRPLIERDLQFLNASGIDELLGLNDRERAAHALQVDIFHVLILEN
jgi:hypothetical protein